MTKPEIFYTGPIVNRADAEINGLKYFFTGSPCIRGHIDQRFTSSRGCKTCSAQNRSKWRKENHDRDKKISAKWRGANLEHKKAYQSRWDAENPHYKGYWYSINKDKKNEYVSEWQRQNPEKRSASERRRRGKLKNAKGTHTAQDVKDIYASQGGECVYCGADLSEGYHVDHIMPLVLGGSNWPENLQCLCPTCNLRKGPKHPDDWHKEIGFE